MFLILRPSTFNTRMSSQTCVVSSLQFTYAAHTLRVVSTSRQSGTSSTSRKQKSVSSRLRNDYNQTLTHQLNEQIVNPKFFINSMLFIPDAMYRDLPIELLH